MKSILQVIILCLVFGVLQAQEVALITPKSPTIMHYKSLLKAETIEPASAMSFAYSYSLGEEDICAMGQRSKGTTFRIQFKVVDGFSANTGEFDHLKELGEFYPEYIFGKKITRYLLGEYTTRSEAEYFLQKVWKEGYEHAFILTYQNGFRLSN
jgi:hypothetical protein